MEGSSIIYSSCMGYSVQMQEVGTKLVGSCPGSLQAVNYLQRPCTCACFVLVCMFIEVPEVLIFLPWDPAPPNLVKKTVFTFSKQCQHHDSTPFCLTQTWPLSMMRAPAGLWTCSELCRTT
jgi:hypothetical protein